MFTLLCTWLCHLKLPCHHSMYHLNLKGAHVCLKSCLDASHSHLSDVILGNKEEGGVTVTQY